MKKTLLTLCFLVSLGFGNTALSQEVSAGEKVTLGITKITANATLNQKLGKEGKKDTLSRVLESMDSNLTSAIQSTRKFELVSRSDLDAVSKEIAFAESGNVATDKNAAKSGMLKGAKFILVVSVDDFQDYIEKATFASLGKTVEKRILRLGAVAKIINSSTGSIVETTNFTLNNADVSDKSSGISADGNLNDSLVGEMTRLMANKIAVRVADVIFPAKIIAKTGKIATLNRGDGTGIKAGDVFEVFALGEALIDPDTGENLGSEEIRIGKLKITRVTPKASQAEILEDNGVAKGQILRPVAQ